MGGMDRSTPLLTRLSAMFALLIAALAAGPIDSASAQRPTVAARSLLAELVAPLPGKQLAAADAAEDPKGKSGGAPAVLASGPRVGAPSAGAAHVQGEAAPRADRPAAGYRARAPPAA